MRKLIASFAAMGMMLMLVSCEPNNSEPSATDPTTSPQIDPAYVIALCDALTRFRETSGLTAQGLNELDSRTLVIRSLRSMRSALDRFASDLESVGLPPVEGGDALLQGWLAALDDGIRQLDSTLEHPKDIPRDSPAQLALFQDVVTPASMVPAALSVLVGAGRPGLVVSLDDPVAASTVARLTSLLEAEQGVASAKYEDKVASCARFRELYEDQPAILEGVDCEAIPAIIRISMTEPDAAPGIVRSIEDEDGVRAVANQAEGLRGLYQLLQISDGQMTSIAPLLESGPDQSACAPLVDEAAKLLPSP